MTNTNSELENKYGNLSNANLFDLVVNKHDDNALFYILFYHIRSDLTKLAQRYEFVIPAVFSNEDLLMDFFFYLHDGKTRNYEKMERIEQPEKFESWLKGAFLHFLQQCGQRKMVFENENETLEQIEAEENHSDYSPRLTVIHLFERVNVCLSSRERLIFFFDICKKNDIVICSEQQLLDILQITPVNLRQIRCRLKSKILNFLMKHETAQ